MHKIVISDLLRVAGFSLASFILFWLAHWVPGIAGEPAISPFFTTSAIIVGMAAPGHIARRLYMPGLDFQLIVRKACENPVGAGLSALGVSLIICTLLLAQVLLMR